MGNSASLCSDKNAIRIFDENGLPVYPTANNSYAPSGQLTPQQQQLQVPPPTQPQQQQIYRTTIPVNSCSCQCQSPATSSATTAEIRQNDDVTNTAVTAPLATNQLSSNCCCSSIISNPSAATAAAAAAMRNCGGGKNHTTPTTATAAAATATTIEYELTNGIAKLCKISTSRIAIEHSLSSSSPSTKFSTVANEDISKLNETLKKREENIWENRISTKNTSNLPPLLTVAELNDLNRGLNAINAFNHHTTKTQNRTLTNYQQTANFSTMECTNAEQLNGSALGNVGTSDENDIPSTISGQQRLWDKKYNKGLAFTIEERQLLGIHGLLPANVKSEDAQVKHCLLLLDRLENDLDKYIYLQSLASRNERLFYRVLSSDVTKMMPLVYTPTVGLACQKFSMIYMDPKGLYITIKDKGHVYEVLKNWRESDVRAIVVTDGERILGLGDLGANGMGIPVGKLSLYTALAGIPPSQCLPVCLDVGTNTQSILDDPLYIGLKQKRVTGPDYDEFLDEFMQAVVRRFGRNCLIQFEDFGNANAFRLLEKYRDCYCTFNDDIQGTASVAVAGLMASLKIKQTKLKDNTIMFLGAGEAALGIANLCVMSLMREGLSMDEAKKHIWMLDSKGLIVKNRPSGGLTSHKLHFAQSHEPIDTLLEAVRVVKPTVLIGASAIGGAFTKEILEMMAANTETPIIFALSNPTSKAECTAEQAYTYTKGKCIFASGSPFNPVTYEGKKFYPGQGNNSYIFPGVALAVLCAGMTTIPEEVFLIAAQKLAELCSPEDLAMGSLYPPLSKITGCSVEIAAAVMDYAYKTKLATKFPEPEDYVEYIKTQMYSLHYPASLPSVWHYKL